VVYRAHCGMGRERKRVAVKEVFFEKGNSEVERQQFQVRATMDRRSNCDRDHPDHEHEHAHEHNDYNMTATAAAVAKPQASRPTPHASRLAPHSLRLTRRTLHAPRQDFANEVKILKLVQHPNIVRFLGAVQDR